MASRVGAGCPEMQRRLFGVGSSRASRKIRALIVQRSATRLAAVSRPSAPNPHAPQDEVSHGTSESCAPLHRPLSARRHDHCGLASPMRALALASFFSLMACSGWVAQRKGASEPGGSYSMVTSDPAAVARARAASEFECRAENVHLTPHRGHCESTFDVEACGQRAVLFCARYARGMIGGEEWRCYREKQTR